MLRIILCIGCLIFIFSQPIVAQTTATDEKPSRFELSVKKHTYYVAEPMDLILALYNDLDNSIKGGFRLDFGTSQLNVYYRKAGHTFTRYYPKWAEIVSSFCIWGSTEILAHDKFEVTETIFYNSTKDQIVFAEPGEYEFKATANVGNNRFMDSNIIQVKVINPPEQERAAMLAILQDKELAGFIEGDRDDGLVKAPEVEIGAVRAASFLENYGQSIYAPKVLNKLINVLHQAVGRGGERSTPTMEIIYSKFKPLYDSINQ